MRVIKTVYKGPTNSRGSRIIANDGNGNRVIVPYNHELNIDGNHLAAAYALCKRLGWSCDVVAGWYKNDRYFILKG